MKGDAQVIAYLQAQLKNELTAINQYFVHYRMFKHWGLDKLAKKEYEESIGEMKHADRLMDRIFMLDGLPNLQDLGKLMIGEDVLEALNSDLRLETGAQATVKDGIAQCESVRDYVSRDLLQDILDDTEEHIDFLETQIELAAKVGIQNYLQSQMGELNGAFQPRCCFQTKNPENQKDLSISIENHSHLFIQWRTNFTSQPTRVLQDNFEPAKPILKTDPSPSRPGLAWSSSFGTPFRASCASHRLQPQWLEEIIVFTRTSFSVRPDFRARFAATGGADARCIGIWLGAKHRASA